MVKPTPIQILVNSSHDREGIVSREKGRGIKVGKKMNFKYKVTDLKIEQGDVTVVLDPTDCIREGVEIVIPKEILQKLILIQELLNDV